MTHSRNQSGNALIITLVALILVGVGVTAYMSGYLPFGQKDNGFAEGMAGAESASNGEVTLSDSAAEQLGIEPGNPVVAKVGGEEIQRLDVLGRINNLPPNVRQQPVQQVFAIAQEQAINETLLDKKSKNANLESDPAVKKQLAEAKANIIRNVYLQKQIDERVTEDRMREMYQQYIANFPEVEEAKASHILVEDEAKAKELITQLNEGADFAALARDNSTDGTAENGGDLGYFAATDVVKPFADAAFAMEVGTYTKTPVKSDFGYHVIKVEDKRMRQPESYESLKPYIEPQLRQQIIGEIVNDLREGADVEVYDINGQPVTEQSAAPAFATQPPAQIQPSDEAPAAAEGAAQ